MKTTDKLADLAWKISNDISEGIDCGESRKTLRKTIAFFANIACVESQRAAIAESKFEFSSIMPSEIGRQRIACREPNADLEKIIAEIPSPSAVQDLVVWARTAAGDLVARRCHSTSTDTKTA